MPTPTYDLIEEKVLGSAQASVTFSSIPGTYKDLVLEWTGGTTVTGQDVRMQLNSDTGTNYSLTWLSGNGTSATSGRETTRTYWLSQVSGGTSAMNAFTWQIMSYANTNVHKTALCRASSPGGEVTATANRWASTSAINTIYLYPTGSTTFISGSTFRLWGVSG